MKALLILLILSLGVYVGYRYIEQQKEDQAELQARQQEVDKTRKIQKETKTKASGLTKETSTGASYVSAKAKRTAKKIFCPWCKGYGKQVIIRAGGTNRYYPCPTCNGVGQRVANIPQTAGVSICDICKGMGRVLTSSSGKIVKPPARPYKYRYRSKFCPKCNSTGYKKRATN